MRKSALSLMLLHMITLFILVYFVLEGKNIYINNCHNKHIDWKELAECFWENLDGSFVKYNQCPLIM